MRKRILLVEDNEPIRQNTRELLEYHEYQVITANNGQEGLEMGALYRPDLILCDIKMPVMNGYKMLRYVRKLSIFRKSRFVFFSAYAEKKAIQLALKMGADGYIVKPFTEEELVGKLKGLLGIMIFPLLQYLEMVPIPSLVG